MANSDPIPTTHGNIFIWQLSEKAPVDAAEAIKKLYDYSGRWWARWATSVNPIKVLIANHNEAEWVCAQKFAWFGNYIQPNCVEVESNGMPDIPTAGQSQFGSKQIDMYEIDSLNALNNFFFYGRIEHEFTHNIFYAQSYNYQNKVPCWLTEGGAEYFGNLIAFSANPNLYIQVRNSKIINSNLRDVVAQYNEKDWYDFIVRTDRSSIPATLGDHCLSVRNEIYHHSTLANEYLVWKVGVPGFLELIKNGSNTSWRAAMEAKFGKSLESIYADMASYMNSQYRLIQANRWSIEEISKVPFGR